MIEREDDSLTSYVLDELDAETRAQVARKLAESPELREDEVEIRAAAERLTRALFAEPAVALPEEYRRRIAKAARGAARATRGSLLRLTAAACLIAAPLALLLLSALREPRSVNTGALADSRRGSSPSPAIATAPPSPPSQGSGTPSPAVPPARRDAPARLASAVPEIAAVPTRAPAVVSSTESTPMPPARTVVRGVVRDASGGVIPGATIEVRSRETGELRQVVSNVRGEFETAAPPGRVQLKASLSGFVIARNELPAPASGAVIDWNPVLQVADISEAITVAGESIPLSTQSASVASAKKAKLAEERSGSASGQAAGVPGGVVGGVIGGLPHVLPRRRLPDDAREPWNREAYAYRRDNAFLEVARDPLSTFGADVDTASYSNVRRFLNHGSLPPADAVRIEELVNYFPYAYEPPHGGDAFAAHLEAAPAPWRPEHLLLRVGLKAREIAVEKRPPSNLVFLIDVSGSMEQRNKLPLVQRSLGMLVDQLTELDRVAIVVYAGAAGLVLPSTPGSETAAIRGAIDRLRAGGSTNGAGGIRLAYEIAAAHFIRGGVNRVILATDGDWNVGVTDEGSLVRLIQAKARSGVFLSVLGFGMGNYQDGRMEALADKGNGNYAYIDTENEARKALVEQLSGTLVTVAKDVKIQVEFNPARVRAYRLLGYENRLLRAEDFKDDKKDGGEVGAGHAVTVLYELIPVGAPSSQAVDELRYQTERRLTRSAARGEIARLALRYKHPEGSTSRPREWVVTDRALSLEEASEDFRFAAAVAAFGMLLRDSPHKGAATFAAASRLAEDALGADESGYRREFLSLVAEAERLAQRRLGPGGVRR
jgi:Ca-activated chloride channel family protein